MLAEFAKYITTLGQKSQGIDIRRIPGTDDLVVRKGVEFEKVPLPPPRRAWCVDSIDDLVAIHGDLMLDLDERRPAVFVALDKIVLLYDEADGREQVHMPFRETRQWRHLLDLDRNPPQLSASAARRLLRYQFRGVPEAVIGAVARSPPQT